MNFEASHPRQEYADSSISVSNASPIGATCRTNRGERKKGADGQASANNFPPAKSSLVTIFQ